MFWFLLGLVLYLLLLYSERALIGISPHDLEQLQANPSPAAQRAWRLAREVRPVLSALLLARLLILVLTVVSATAWWMQQEPIRQLRDAAGQPGWAAAIVWGCAAVW